MGGQVIAPAPQQRVGRQRDHVCACARRVRLSKLKPERMSLLLFLRWCYLAAVHVAFAHDAVCTLHEGQRAVPQLQRHRKPLALALKLTVGAAGASRQPSATIFAPTPAPVYASCWSRLSVNLLPSLLIFGQRGGGLALARRNIEPEALRVRLSGLRNREVSGLVGTGQGGRNLTRSLGVLGESRGGTSVVPSEDSFT